MGLTAKQIKQNENSVNWNKNQQKNIQIRAQIKSDGITPNKIKECKKSIGQVDDLTFWWWISKKRRNKNVTKARFEAIPPPKQSKTDKTHLT